MPRLIDGTCRWQRLSSRKLSSLKRETPGMKIDGQDIREHISL